MNQVRTITSPETELLDLADVKNYLKIDHDDEDDLLTMLITAAREQIERWCGVSIGEQTREWTFDNVQKMVHTYYPSAAMAKRNIDFYPVGSTDTEIPYGPVIEVTGVQEKGDTTYAAYTDYETDGEGFTTIQTGAGRFKVTYTAGYDADTLPQGLKLVWKQFIAYLYTNRQEEDIKLPAFIVFALQPYKRSLI